MNGLLKLILGVVLFPLFVLMILVMALLWGWDSIEENLTGGKRKI